MVTGKNKERFEDWYGRYDENYIDFYCLQPEMQKGVYESYYRSVGFEIILKYGDWTRKKYYGYIIHCSDGRKLTIDTALQTPKEAFTEALKEANKLSNEQLNK